MTGLQLAQILQRAFRRSRSLKLAKKTFTEQQKSIKAAAEQENQAAAEIKLLNLFLLSKSDLDCVAPLRIVPRELSWATRVAPELCGLRLCNSTLRHLGFQVSDLAASHGDEDLSFYGFDAVPPLSSHSVYGEVPVIRCRCRGKRGVRH